MDEHQHRFGYDSLLSCDAKRISNIHTSLSVEISREGRDVPRIYWMRYNPNASYIDGDLVKVRKEEKEKRLTTFLNTLCSTHPVTIAYAFYDVSEGGLQVLDNPEFPSELRQVVQNIGCLD